jgi:hypothetical protein
LSSCVAAMRSRLSASPASARENCRNFSTTLLSALIWRTMSYARSTWAVGPVALPPPASVPAAPPSAVAPGATLRSAGNLTVAPAFSSTRLGHLDAIHAVGAIPAHITSRPSLCACSIYYVKTIYLKHGIISLTLRPPRSALGRAPGREDCAHTHG